MENFLLAFLSALWLGILTSISPCPLATNVAAISFLSKKIIHPKAVFLSGLLYTMGRMFAYAVLGFIITKSILSIPVLANFLQRYMNKILGPTLLVTGLFLLDLLKLNFLNISFSEKHHHRLADLGLTGNFLLGLLFAMAFCPVSAALFFGSLIPLALNYKMGIIMPFIYGIGTGLPVLLFAVAIALGITSLSHWFRRLTKLEFYMKKITGIVFILVGLYYIKIYLLRIGTVRG